MDLGLERSSGRELNEAHPHHSKHIQAPERKRLNRPENCWVYFACLYRNCDDCTVQRVRIN